MQTSCPGGASSASLGRSCCLHKLHARARHGRLSRSRVLTKAENAQQELSEQSSPAPGSNGTSKNNGGSNGTNGALISSNNGVVLDRKGGSLEDRILSGEFSRKRGSFKEKVSRPVRQALAQDPLGPGIAGVHKAACVAQGLTFVCTA